MSSITDFRLSAADIQYVSTSLSRPECVMSFLDGNLLVSDNRAAVIRIKPDGTHELVGAMKGRPNGFAVTGDGELYIANIEQGKFYHVARDGREAVILDTFEGKPVGAANFVYADPHHEDRLWLSVSTVTVPRSRAEEEGISDGFILLRDSSGVRRVASEFTFTNELRISRDGAFLYAAETATARISRLRISADGSLTDRTIFGPAPIFPGARIDGIAFDADENLWVTELTRNALFAITPEGQLHTVFEDPDGRALEKPSSLAFGGPDMQTVYVGSLTSPRLASFRSPVPGLPMRHWNVSW
jgi:gluconolactonase